MTTSHTARTPSPSPAAAPVRAESSGLHDPSPYVTAFLAEQAGRAGMIERYFNFETHETVASTGQSGLDNFQDVCEESVTRDLDNVLNAFRA